MKPKVNLRLVPLLAGLLIWNVSSAVGAGNEPLKFIWNYPDNACRQNHFDFKLADYGIESNLYGFQGEKIALLYSGRFGKWPHIDHNTRQWVNGGLPQKADVPAHLQAMDAALRKASLGSGPGLGIFDMELWRPILDRNFGRFTHYKLISLEETRKDFPYLSEDQLAKKNAEIWSNASRVLMEESLRKIKQIWPDKQWGYYGYPEYSARLRNDELKWLWDLTDAFYPSVYIKRYDKGLQGTKEFIGKKLEEAFRVRRLYGRPEIPIIAYTLVESASLGKLYGDWLDLAVRVPAEMGVDGIVLWATSKVFAQPVLDNCGKQVTYVTNILGPKIQKVLNRLTSCSTKLCGGRGRCVSKEYASTNPYATVKYPFRFGNRILYSVPVNSAYNQFMADFLCQCYEGWMGARCHYRFQ